MNMTIPVGLDKADFALAVYMLVWAAINALFAVFYLDIWLFGVAACLFVFAGAVYSGKATTGFLIGLLVGVVVFWILSPNDPPRWPYVLVALGYAAYYGYRLVRKYTTAG